MNLYGEKNPVFKHKEIVNQFAGLDKEQKRSVVIGARIWGVAIGIVVSKSAKEKKATIDFSAVCKYLYNSPYNNEYKNEIIENAIRIINLLNRADEGEKIYKQTNDPILRDGGVMTSKDLAGIYLSLVDGDQSFVDTGNYVHPAATLLCWLSISVSYRSIDVSKASEEVQAESLIKYML